MRTVTMDYQEFFNFKKIFKNKYDSWVSKGVVYVKANENLLLNLGY